MATRVNPFLPSPGGSQGAGNERPNPFLPGSQPASTSKRRNPFLPGAAAEGGSESLPVLEQQAQAVGAPAVPQDSPGLFRRAVDIISRPNYAVAGAAEELFSPQGGGAGAALKRAGTELFSGIGGLQGQKEGFGQVLEQAGVGSLGNFSDIPGVSSLFNETGQGWQFQKGGWADPTGRGAIGLGLDIVTDPTTYLGFGVAGKTAKVEGKFLSKTGQQLLEKETVRATESLATRAAAIKAMKAADPTITSIAANTLIGRGTEAAPVLRDLAIGAARKNVQAAIEGGAKDLLDRGGIKWAGIHIADNPLTAIANSGLAADVTRVLAPTPLGRATASSVAWTKKYLTDPVQQLLVRGFGVRGLEGARQMMDDFVNKEGYLKFKAGEDIKASPFAKWYDLSQEKREAIFRPVIDAFQKGGVGAVPDEFKPAMAYYAKKMEDMYGSEVAAGLLQKEQKLLNYFAHYYHNDVDELAQVVYKQNGGLVEFKDVVTKLLRMGRNAEERAYATLADAESISKTLNAQNKAIPVLKGVYDPIDSLTRRWEHSITKRNTREMMQTLESKYGRLPVNDVFDLASPVQYGRSAARKQAVVEHLLNAPSKDVRTEATTVSKVFQTPELRLANANLRNATAVPNAHLKQTLDLVNANLGKTLKLAATGLENTGNLAARQTAAELRAAADAAQAAHGIIGRGMSVEVRSANKELAAAWDSFPLKHYEKETLKSADEASFYRRRGWDLVQRDDGGIDAYRVVDVQRHEYVQAMNTVKRARGRLDAAVTKANVESARNAKRSMATASDILDRSSVRQSAAAKRVQAALADADKQTTKATEQAQRQINVLSKRANSQVKAATERATRDVHVPGELTKGVDKVSALKKAPDEVKREFFRQRFLQVGSREESQAVLEKYRGFEQYFPKKLVNYDTDFAVDGSRFMAFNPGQGSNYTAVLPETLGREVAAMSDFVVTNKAARTLLQGFDTVNNFWKGSVTWLFPSFHVRNAYSNVAQSFIDIGMHSVNPESYIETGKILFGKGPGTFKTALGTYTYDEVRDILNRHGINTSARAVAEFTGNESKILKPFAKAREAGTAIENESRAQLALNYLRRGMEPEEVGARVRKFQLDYANGLTSFERQWMKRLIPFYSFQRLNLGLQLENIVKRPGMLATELKPFRGRADENAQMTSWDAGALKLRLNRDGKNVQMITGIDLPIRNLDLIFRGNLKDTIAGTIGMTTPIVKTAIEYGAGKNLFTGKDLAQPVNVPAAGRLVEKMPVSMQKFLGYTKTFDKAGRPQYTLDGQRYYLLGQAYIASRFLSTADRQWKQYVDKADGNALQSLLDFSTGLRWQDMDMNEERARRQKERVKDLEEGLIRWNQRSQYERVYKRKGK